MFPRQLGKLELCINQKMCRMFSSQSKQNVARINNFTELDKQEYGKSTLGKLYMNKSTPKDDLAAQQLEQT